MKKQFYLYLLLMLLLGIGSARGQETLFGNGEYEVQLKAKQIININPETLTPTTYTNWFIINNYKIVVIDDIVRFQYKDTILNEYTLLKETMFIKKETSVDNERFLATTFIATTKTEDRGLVAIYISFIKYIDSGYMLINFDYGKYGAYYRYIIDEKTFKEVKEISKIKKSD
jgi:hypothetical protein